MKAYHHPILTASVALIAAFLLAVLLTMPLAAQSAETPQPPLLGFAESDLCPAFAQGALCDSYKPYCYPNCKNTPFCPTSCWPTTWGPAAANVDVSIDGSVETSDILYCESPEKVTLAYCGNAGAEDLPCIPNSAGTVANCTCQTFQSNVYFVGLYSILNLGAYYETVAKCGLDGSRCKNITNCGKTALTAKSKECESYPMAPVCEYINHQRPNDPQHSFFPKADTISVFSFSEEAQGQDGTCPAGPYAGGMTAPCYFENGDEDSPTVQCLCPIYDSPNSYIHGPDQECPSGNNVIVSFSVGSTSVPTQ